MSSIPADATNLHFEGELVVVIGRKAQNVSVADAPSYVFGVTAGQRHQRARLAARRPAVVPRQGVGHVRARWDR